MAEVSPTFLGESVRYMVIAIKDVQEQKVHIRFSPVLDFIHPAAEEGDAISLMHLQARPASARDHYHGCLSYLFKDLQQCLSSSRV